MRFICVVHQSQEQKLKEKAQQVRVSYQRFTERANIAQERRDNIKIAEKAKISSDKNHLRAKKASTKIKASKRSSYWLLTISVKELFNLLFFRKTGASQ